MTTQKMTRPTFLPRFQNRLIRGIVDAPWYIRNDNLHKDMDMETVDSVMLKVTNNDYIGT
jgi:hypothetical protein